jgi:hypothetical protein
MSRSHAAIGTILLLALIASFGTAHSSSTWNETNQLPLAPSLMRGAFAIFIDPSQESSLMDARNASAKAAGFRVNAFSVGDSRAERVDAKKYFPRTTVAPRLSAKALTSALDVASNGALKNVSVRELGFVDGYSATAFDEILSFNYNRVRVLRSRTEPGSDSTLKVLQIIAGDVLLMIGTGNSSGYTPIGTAMLGELNDPSVQWDDVTATSSLTFSGTVSVSSLPRDSALVDMKGRINNQLFELGRLSLRGGATTFASLTQINYYNPGCCWSLLQTPPPKQNAFLVVANQRIGRVIFEGSGDVEPDV